MEHRLGVPALLGMAMLLLTGCEWDKQLPFKKNGLDPALVGFWWKLLPDTTFSFALYEQALIEFKPGEELNTMRRWNVRGGEPYQHVEADRPKPVFTKRGMIYVANFFIQAAPYALHGDTLTVKKNWPPYDYPVYYVRIADTSGLDWAAWHRKSIRPKYRE